MKVRAYQLFVLLVLLCGCRGRQTSQVTDSTGSNQLALIYRRVWSWSDISQLGTAGYDFESLIWRTNSDSKWKDRITISKADFQRGRSRLRWVSEIHSIDGLKGTAIIKVAEGDPPKGGMVNYIYSWREWSLRTNGEVRFIRVCTNVFEKF